MLPVFESDERDKLATFCSALISLGDSLSLPQLISLLTVAIEPGLSVNDLSDRIAVPQQSASRYAAALLGRYQSVLDKGPIQPLISQEVSVDDPRKRALFLTDAGYDLLGKLIKFQSTSISSGTI